METKQVLLDWILTSYLISDNFNLENSLFFLHWWGQSKSSFSKIYKILDEKSISYIALDFPWFGSSAFPDFDWEITDYADFTKDFIKRIWLVKPTLIWHSFWWRVCIILWSSEYDNINKLVLIWAAWIKQKTNKIRYYISKAWKLFFSIPWLNWIWEKIKNKVWSSDYINSWRLKQIFINTINKDLTPLLQYVKYPTLLLRWLKDTETPVADGILMNNTIDDTKIKIFEHWTHFVHDEFPNEVFEEIEKFI